MPMLLALSQYADGQTVPAGPENSNVATGISIGRLRDDPTIALDLSAPRVLSRRFGVHAQLSRTWLEAYKATCDHWAGYTAGWLGLIYIRRISDQVRFTSEAGAYMVYASRKYSSRTSSPGYYTACGVELYSLNPDQRQTAFLLEAGYGYTGAHADRL